MTPYQYWRKSLDSLPDTSGPLSEKLTSATIHDANEAARAATSKQSAKRGRYAKFTPEQQAEVARYALMYGNIAAQRRFSRKLGTDIKESTIRTWKIKYQAAVSLKKGSSGDQDVSVTSLPTKKRGRPLMLGEKLDEEVQYYIRAVREGGGVITTAITMASATAIVRRADRNLLSENGGPISITVNWAKSLLYRMGFVKRRGSTAMKMTVSNFESVKEKFLLDIRVAREMEDIPHDLNFQLGSDGNQHRPRIDMDDGAERIEGS